MNKRQRKKKAEKHGQAALTLQEAPVSLEEKETGEMAFTSEGEQIPSEESLSLSKETNEAEATSPLDSLRPAERAMLIAALASRIRKKAEDEEKEAVKELATDPRYAEIETRDPSMKAAVTDFPFLADLGTRERLIAAYHIDRSLHPAVPSPEEQLTALLSDPAMLYVLSARFAELMAEKRNTLPPMAVHSGTQTPPADTKRAPRDLREASDAAKKFLGFTENKQKRSM